MIEYYWSRQPGKFINKTTGDLYTGGTFTGTVREWYEILIEVMIDVGLSCSIELNERPLRYLSWRGDANMVTIVEASVLYKPIDRSEFGVIGQSASGIICNIPIKADPGLFKTGRLELIQFEGSSAERIIGKVQIVDQFVYG